MKNIVYFLSMLAVLSSCDSKTNTIDETDGLQFFSKDSLAKSITVLAGDAFSGRKPFTEGETKTINYLREKFIHAGLEPGNGNSFFQEVPMVNISALATPNMNVTGDKENFILKGRDDYAIWTNKTDSTVSWKNDEVVFAGYGVVAPEYNWNDYAGLDVKGKIVLILVNDPGFNAGDTTLSKEML